MRLRASTVSLFVSRTGVALGWPQSGPPRSWSTSRTRTTARQSSRGRGSHPPFSSRLFKGLRWSKWGPLTVTARATCCTTSLTKVWPLTKFFSAPFFVKNHWFAWRSNQWPLVRKHFSLSFLPATPSSQSWTLEELFELTRRPSQALDSPRALLPAVRCFAIGLIHIS